MAGERGGGGCFGQDTGGDIQGTCHILNLKK